MANPVIVPILAATELSVICPITAAVRTATTLPAINTALSLNLRPLLGGALLDELQGYVNTVRAIASATNANPVVITTDSVHGISVSGTVTIGGAMGMALDGTYVATVLTPTTYSIPLNGTSLGSYEESSAKAGVMSALFWELWENCRQSVAWWATVQIIPFQWAQIREAGLVKLSSADSEPAAIGDVKLVQQTARRNAEAYDTIISEFLCDNSTAFPRWRNDPSGDGNTAYPLNENRRFDLL